MSAAHCLDCPIDARDRTVAVGGGGVCAAAETATTIVVKRIPVVVNRMMSSYGSRYISPHIAKLQALAGSTFDLGWGAGARDVARSWLTPQARRLERSERLRQARLGPPAWNAMHEAQGFEFEASVDNPPSTWFEIRLHIIQLSPMRRVLSASRQIRPSSGHTLPLRRRHDRCTSDSRRRAPPKRSLPCGLRTSAPEWCRLS
jgi:hypothetical protein